MGQVIGDILPSAIGVAISPLPIIAVILMLFSERARQNGPAFLVGWIGGLTAAVVLVLIVAGAAGASSGGPSTLASLIQLGLGLLLLVLGLMQWKKRPASGAEVETPAWMAAIDSLQPPRAAMLGVLLSAANPKNLTLAIAGAVAIGKAGLDVGGSLVAVLVFVAVGSVSIIVPVGYYLLGGESARLTLDGWKAWLLANNATVMTVLFLVLGVTIAGKGLGALLG